MTVFLIIALSVWFIGTLAFMAYDSAWGATCTLVIVGVLTALFYGFTQTLLYLKELPITWFGATSTVVIYLVIGILWSFFKFYRHVKSNKSNYKTYGMSEIDKRTIGTWIVYWPFSVLIYILGDLIREFINWVVNQFQGIYKRLMEKALNSN